MKLGTLALRLDGEYTDAPINGVLAALAILPSLSRLYLQLASYQNESAVDLGLLGACSSLTDLRLASVDNYHQQATTARGCGKTPRGGSQHSSADSADTDWSCDPPPTRSAHQMSDHGGAAVHDPHAAEGSQRALCPRSREKTRKGKDERG